MHWFFALSEHSPALHEFEQMVMVAVSTALRYTSLIPHFLYDGQASPLTDWLERRGVSVTFARTPLFSDFQALANRRQDPRILGIASGTFLRLEVPRLALELGAVTALYTDVDVMFTGDVCELEAMRPAFFAAAPEMDINNSLVMNAGVMLMNSPALASDYDYCIRFAVDHIDRLQEIAWDQGMYAELYAGRWEHLPPQYNWKPYWGPPDGAKIIHFHGPKPTYRPRLASTPHQIFRDLATGSFWSLCEQWDAELSSSTSTLHSLESR